MYIPTVAMIYFFPDLQHHCQILLPKAARIGQFGSSQVHARVRRLLPRKLTGTVNTVNTVNTGITLCEVPRRGKGLYSFSSLTLELDRLRE